MKRSLKISRSDLRYVLAFALVATIATSVVAFTILNPPPKEQFFAMWILGSKGLAEDYYPNNDPTLTVGEPVNWTLGVSNQMGGIEYVVLRVKLLNSTLPSPDQQTGKPSSVASIFEFRRILVDNETWSVPFIWRILNLTRQGRSLAIANLSINQYSLKGNIADAISGNDFRFVFELWFYDEVTGHLAFAWNVGGEYHSVWTQIWFNATMTP